MAEQCGLLLDRVPGGMTSEQAEDLTSLPMYSLVDRAEYLQRLSGWLVAEESFPPNRSTRAKVN